MSLESMPVSSIMATETAGKKRRYSTNNKQAQREHWKLIDHCEKLMMMFEEKKAQHISEVNGQKVYLYSAHCKNQFDQI
jgi:hypothetical protein